METQVASDLFPENLPLLIEIEEGGRQPDGSSGPPDRRQPAGEYSGQAAVLIGRQLAQRFVSQPFGMIPEGNRPVIETIKVVD